LLYDEATNTATPCECRERLISSARARRIAAGVPKRFRGVSFDRAPINGIDPVKLRQVRLFIDQIGANLDSGRGLWFHGDVGTGKTSLAMLIAKAALEARRTVAVYSVPALLARIRSTYDERSDEPYDGLFRRLVAVDLLVLDDLGAERQTEWVLEQLYALVNERWQDQRSIVVTTNMPREDPSELRRSLRAITVAAQDVVESERASDDLAKTVSRLERVAERLERLESLSGDPLVRLREQVGTRTISRLQEMCDDYIPIMGPDLRATAHGA
jgi:DNA replication protein DnaC